MKSFRVQLLKNCQHLTNWTKWNKREKLGSSATSLFNWRFRSRRGRFWLNSLIDTKRCITFLTPVEQGFTSSLLKTTWIYGLLRSQCTINSPKIVNKILFECQAIKFSLYFSYERLVSVACIYFFPFRNWVLTIALLNMAKMFLKRSKKINSASSK